MSIKVIYGPSGKRLVAYAVIGRDGATIATFRFKDHGGWYNAKKAAMRAFQRLNTGAEAA